MLASIFASIRPARPFVIDVNQTRFLHQMRASLRRPQRLDYLDQDLIGRIVVSSLGVSHARGQGSQRRTSERQPRLRSRLGALVTPEVSREGPGMSALPQQRTCSVAASMSAKCQEQKSWLESRTTISAMETVLPYTIH